MGIWHELLISKHCYFFNITLSWIKIWRWRCRRYLHSHVFLLCEKFQGLKFRSYSQKKHFLSFLEIHNCAWYLHVYKLTFLSVEISNNIRTTLYLYHGFILVCHPLWMFFPLLCSPIKYPKLWFPLTYRKNYMGHTACEITYQKHIKLSDHKRFHRSYHCWYHHSDMHYLLIDQWMYLFSALLFLPDDFLKCWSPLLPNFLNLPHFHSLPSKGASGLVETICVHLKVYKLIFITFYVLPL